MSKRVLPVHKTKWEKIRVNANCVTNDEDSDRREYLESINRGSKELLKKWEYSLGKAMRDKMKEDELQKTQNLEANMEFYRKLLQDKDKEKEKILAYARDTFFKQTDEPKALLSAFLYAEMLKEQQGQREFNQKIKGEQKQRDIKYAEFLDEKWDEWHREQVKKQKLATQKNVEYSTLMRNRGIDEKKRLSDEVKTKKEWEKVNREIAQRELKELEEREQETKKRNYQIFVDNINMRLELERERRAREESQRIKEDKLIDIYNNTQAKINQICKQQQKQIERQKEERRNVVRRMFYDDTKDRQKREEERVKKAKEEKLEREKVLIEAEKSHRQIMKQEKINSYEEWLKIKAQTLNEREEQRVKDVENKNVNYEYSKTLQGQMRAEHQRKADEIKLFNLMQIRENREKRARETADRVKFYGSDRKEDMCDADIKFFKFAHRLLEECKKTGRPTQPLQKVIKDYRQRYLHPRETMSRRIISEFPLFQTSIDDKIIAEQIKDCKYCPKL